MLARTFRINVPTVALIWSWASSLAIVNANEMYGMLQQVPTMTQMLLRNIREAKKRTRFWLDSRGFLIVSIEENKNTDAIQNRPF